MPDDTLQWAVQSGWTDRFAVWVVDSGGPQEAQVQSYSPGVANVPSWEDALTPPGELDWTVPLRRRCGLMWNYFDYLFMIKVCGGKRENYPVCSVQYCVQQCAQCNAHTYQSINHLLNRPNSFLDWVLSHLAHFTVLKFIFVYVLFCVSLCIACMCRLVTQWGGPCRIEAWSLGLLLPSVLWHCWLGHSIHKTCPRYDL